MRREGGVGQGGCWALMALVGPHCSDGSDVCCTQASLMCALTDIKWCTDPKAKQAVEQSYSLGEGKEEGKRLYLDLGPHPLPIHAAARGGSGAACVG